MCVDIAGGTLFDWNCVKSVKNQFSRIWFPADGYRKTSATISMGVEGSFCSHPKLGPVGYEMVTEELLQPFTGW